ncbi:FxSxx-COOH cyclophane-containing RiPP peptide [Actinacidiphila alni]|uniref:FxSxx-COOH cyclophane-containing RiPP peptide n=1 Tax=Actinacidiphila alni TaxID=380248 RepID=UPI0033D2B4AB
MDEQPYGGGAERAADEPTADGRELTQGQAVAGPAEGNGTLAERALAEQVPVEQAPAERAPVEQAQAEQPPADSGIDLLGMDLESLRTVEHPVLAALVSDLRERAAGAGGEALWGFESDPAAPEPTR